MKHIALLALVVTAIAACSQVQPTTSPTQQTPAPTQETPSPSASPPSPSASPSAAAAQRYVCGELPGWLCEAVIARVIAQVPGRVASRVAVADFRGEVARTRRGGGLVALVTFLPPRGEDVGMNPPTWLVTQPFFSSTMRVEPWGAGPLPAQFVTLLRSAGFDV